VSTSGSVLTEIAGNEFAFAFSRPETKEKIAVRATRQKPIRSASGQVRPGPDREALHATADRTVTLGEFVNICESTMGQRNRGTSSGESPSRPDPAGDRAMSGLRAWKVPLFQDFG